MSRAIPQSLVAALLCAGLTMSAAHAEDAPGLSLELNAQEQVESGCKLSFLARNTHASDITQAVFETVLFDTSGQVERLTLFDFGTLPAGRPRLRQFVVPGLSCDGLGQILINGANQCSAEGLEPGACSNGLALGSRTPVEVIG